MLYFCMEQTSTTQLFSVDPKQLTDLLEKRAFDENSDVRDFDSLLFALGLNQDMDFSDKTKAELKSASQFHVRKLDDVFKDGIRSRISARSRRFSNSTEKSTSSRSSHKLRDHSDASKSDIRENHDSSSRVILRRNKDSESKFCDEFICSAYRNISKAYFGKNSIDYSPSPSFIFMLLENLQDSTLFLLICAGFLSLGIGFYKLAANIDKLAWIEGVAILLAVSGIVFLSAGSQYSQEKLFSTLQKESHSSTVKICRNKIYDTIKSDDLVVGDVVYLEPGDIVAADCILLKDQSCYCDESMISGESAAVKKSHFSKAGDERSKFFESDMPLRKIKDYSTNNVKSQIKDLHCADIDRNMQANTQHIDGSKIGVHNDLSCEKVSHSDTQITLERHSNSSVTKEFFYIPQGSQKIQLNAHIPLPIHDTNASILKTACDDEIKGDSMHPLLHESPSIQECNKEMQNLCITKSDVPFLISGSYVVEGCAHALVLCVGKHSVQGKIFESMQKARNKTPLEIKISKLAQSLARKSFILAFILLLGHAVKMVSAGSTLEYDKMLHGIVECISIVVMAVPEGLPMAITIALSIGTKRMLKDGLLVRHLAACETMNNCNIICVDKTGTLTHNQMTVKMVFADNKIHRIGTHNKENSYIPSKRQRAVICNEMFTLNASLNSSAFLNANKQFIGSPTEAALLRLLDENGCDFMGLRDQCTIVDRVPFSSERKYMSTTLRFKDKYITLFKGAPEIICKFTKHAIVNSEVVPFEKTLVRNFFKKCDEKHIRTMALSYVIHSDEEYNKMTITSHTAPSNTKVNPISQCIDKSSTKTSKSTSLNSNMTEDFSSQNNLNNTGVTFYSAKSSYSNSKFSSESHSSIKDSNYENASNTCSSMDPLKCQSLSGQSPSIFIAAVGLEDPLRADVSTKIRQCRRSGIIVVMLTGDKQSMAEALASKLGILEEGHICMCGEDFRNMSPLQLNQILPRIRVISRATPLDKQKYVQLMQKKGLIVAVTGDGSNDGPALKAADVGFGMGKSGTEVAKAASSVILINDNFASITKCIEWGQSINASVRKFIQYQLSVTCSAILIATVTLLFDKRNEILFNPVYLLWINIIMDFFAALALATDYPVQNNVKKPENPSNPIIIKTMRYFIAFSTVTISSIIFLLYYTTSMSNTLISNTFIYLLIFNQINSRSLNHNQSVFQNMHKNKTFIISNLLVAVFQFLVTQKFNSIFKTEALSSNDILLSVAIGFSILPSFAIFRYLCSVISKRNSETWIDIYKNVSYELILAKSLRNKSTNI